MPNSRRARSSISCKRLRRSSLQMPANMETVEAQYEDVPRDMECYVDADGNAYDFTFGLNWSGKIADERVQKYNVPALTECENLEFYYANAN